MLSKRTPPLTPFLVGALLAACGPGGGPSSASTTPSRSEAPHEEPSREPTDDAASSEEPADGGVEEDNADADVGRAADDPLASIPIPPSPPTPTLIERLVQWATPELSRDESADASARTRERSGSFTPPSHGSQAVTGRLDPALIRRTVRRHYEPVLACLRADHARDGTIDVGEAQLTPRRLDNGAIEFRMRGSTGDARLDRCLERAVPRLRLPPPEPGSDGYRVPYPILI